MVTSVPYPELNQNPAQAQVPGTLARWAETCEALGATTKKLEKRAVLAAYLLSLSILDAARAAQYIAGAPFPEVDRRNLSVGGALLSKAVSARSAADPRSLALAFRHHGDIGSAAEELIARQDRPDEMASTAPGPDPPALSDLEAALAEIAAARGPAAKLRVLTALLARCSALSCKYILKLIAGDMRIGVKQALVEEAIAAAYTRELAAVRHAGMLLGSLQETIELAAAGTLDQASMRLFHPLGFMLASPVDSVEEAIARFAEEVAAERAEAGVDVPDAGYDGSPHNDPSRIPLFKMGPPEAQPKDSLSYPFPDTVTPSPDQREGHLIGTIAAPAPQAPPAAPQVLLREAQLEDKYDGMRAQLHAGDPAQPGRVGLFSRNREDLRSAFPELMEAFAALPEAAILDGEILAWQPAWQPASQPANADASARALPFSSLQQRLGRKQVSAELRRTHPVVFMAFDILYADGRLLLEETLATRRARLERYLAEHAPETDGRHTLAAVADQGMLFSGSPRDPETPEKSDEGRPDRFPRLLLAPAIRLTGAEQLDAAYAEARARGNEGVMLKAAGSLYQPGRRGLAWLKLKRELATLDVVVTGAEFGTGRRARHLSDYTFAVRAGSGELLNVGKAYSGVTDAEMHELSAHFQAHTLEDFGHYRTVEPDTVFEVAFNNITRSDRHASGFALRFPRILRIRSDKPLDEIDTLARVEELYLSQPDRPAEPA